jgi:prepilin-type N-terminal cleavage/methylation domain-containing protein
MVSGLVEILFDDDDVQPCAATNPVTALPPSSTYGATSRLQSARPAGRVTEPGSLAAFASGMKLRVNQRRGVTLTELLCVLAIIAILAALYLPAIARAFVRVKRFLSGG